MRASLARLVPMKLVISLLIAAFALPLLADEIHLKNQDVIHGTIVKKEGDTFFYRYGVEDRKLTSSTIVVRWPSASIVPVRRLASSYRKLVT